MNLESFSRFPELVLFRSTNLRHTHRHALAVTVGVSVKVISGRLGHASISLTLERYTHVLPSIEDEAVAMVEQLLVV